MPVLPAETAWMRKPLSIFRTAAGVLVPILVASAARNAEAADFVVDADTAAQGYEVASPFGDTVLLRRRLTQTLGFGIYNLQGEYKPGEADYSIVLRMRLDADFGVNAHVN